MKLIHQIAAGIALLAVLLLGACQSAPMPAGDVSPVTGPAASAQEYRLGTGDSLRVTVFGEEALSGDFDVDGSGNISMPLIDSVKVEGLTIPEFEAELERKLRAGYLNEPRVSAEVTNYRPYYILGEVERPDEYTYSSGLTIMNAVAAAGGFTYRANRKFVFVRSAGSESERRVELRSTTPVNPGDTIRIGERIF